MTNIPPVSLPLSAAGADGAKPKTEVEAAKSFEAVFLSQMVDEMMKTVDFGSTMGEHSAEMWRSILSQSLADSLMENGGLGIADNIQNKLNAYKTQSGG